MIYGRADLWDEKKWTFLDHLPTSDLVLSTQFVNDPLRKVLLKFHRKTMGFCTWGNEVPSERGRICQNCRDWFAISRKLVQTFFVEFHFFMETMLFSYFLFGRWSKFISFFLVNVLWCPFLKNRDDDGSTFLSLYSWFFRFHENWEMKKI